MTTATATATRTRSVARPQTAAPDRFDIYRPIHKALRSFMGDTLLRVGRLDVEDRDDWARTFGQLDALLTMCVHHIRHEDDFLHSAIGARQPAGAGRTMDDHAEHLACIDGLRGEMRSLQSAAAVQRPRLALRLYRHLALFIAENFQHMHIEESVDNALLWSLYSDEELVGLQQRLHASIAPAEHLDVLRWLIPALNPAERAGVLGAMRVAMPAEAFIGVVETIRPHLDANDWAKLRRAIGPAAIEAVPLVGAFG